jgi:hypothetical protein
MIEKWKKLRKQFCIFVESKSVYEKHFKFNGRREKWGVTGVGEDVLPVYFLNGKKKESNFEGEKKNTDNIQGVIESCTDILTTSYWLHVELGKNI